MNQLFSHRSYATVLFFSAVLCLVTFLSGCQKDLLAPSSSVSTSTDLVLKNPITSEMAQSWFKSEFGKSIHIAPRSSGISARTVDSTQDGLYFFDETFQITPLWEKSKISTYLRTNPILYVPVEPIAFLDSKGMRYSLVFFRDSLLQISATLQVYKPAESYEETHPKFSVDNFTGLFYQIDLEGRVQRMFAIDNGRAIKRIILPANRSTSIAQRGSCDCFHAGSGESIWEELWCLIRCAFNELNSGGGQDTYFYSGNIGIDVAWLGLGSTGSGSGSSNGGGGGGSSSSNLNSQIDDTCFDIVGDVIIFNYYQNIYVNQKGFTNAQFEQLFSDKDFFQEVDQYLQDNAGDISANDYIKNLLDIFIQAKSFETPTSGFCQKKDLYDFVKNNPNLCPNCNEGQLHNKIGDLFEDAYNRWQQSFMLNVGDYEPNLDNTPNTFKQWSPTRNKYVIPDGFMKSIKNPSGLQLAVNQKAHWVECKASNKDFINLSDYEGQIGGEIEALSIYQPWACQNNIAAMTYVTTIDLTPAPKLISTANNKGIWILNSYAYFKIENGKMFLTFSPTFAFGTQFGQVNQPTIASIYQALSNNYVEFK